MPLPKYKAFAYITHHNNLLVFRHPFDPDAGLQVPAGTIREDEHPEQAVMREAIEETGLTDFVLVQFLGEQQRDMRDFGLDELHHRYFYHLRYIGEPPVTWQHRENEPSDGTGTPIVFEFFWVRLPQDVPALIADHGYFLPHLRASIQTNEHVG